MVARVAAIIYSAPHVASNTFHYTTLHCVTAAAPTCARRHIPTAYLRIHCVHYNYTTAPNHTHTYLIKYTTHIARLLRPCIATTGLPLRHWPTSVHTSYPYQTHTYIHTYLCVLSSCPAHITVHIVPTFAARFPQPTSIPSSTSNLARDGRYSPSPGYRRKPPPPSSHYPPKSEVDHRPPTNASLTWTPPAPSARHCPRPLPTALRETPPASNRSP
ncbi:hypothetical protein F4859DRAFT_215116 [Xylaria cf. heliscus]|nr:hypothetical protein F4859DRAFT_215116 [Xylaria cf. heliscus]